MTGLKSLKEREGELIGVLIPIIHQTAIQSVRLHRYEEAGLWIESQTMIDAILAAIGVTSTPRTIVFFLPWHQITWVMDAVDIPAFSAEVAKL